MWENVFFNNFIEIFRKKNRKRLVIIFFIKLDVFIFFNKSKWIEFIDLFVDDVRGRYSRSVYVYFIVYRLNKYGFFCFIWVK